VNSRTFTIEQPEQRDRLVQFISRRDLPFMVRVGPIREQRTLSQNSLAFMGIASTRRESKQVMRLTSCTS
jgi:hypothetical protein